MKAGAEEGDEVAGATFPLVNLEPVAEPVYDEAEVVALQAEVVTAHMLERVLWSFRCNGWFW